MRAIVICGPSYEPIDEVRRLTNFSTGELGTLLAALLASAGVETVCLRGVGASFPEQPGGPPSRPFTTNQDLANQLQQLAGEAPPAAAVYHAAALADFRVTGIMDDSGRLVVGAKLATESGALNVRLEPAQKLLPQFRAWFPTARLFGWKYELQGTREQAIARAARQIVQCGTDACVLNGRAYGEGFALLHPDGRLEALENKAALCQRLVSDFLDQDGFRLHQ